MNEESMRFPIDAPSLHLVLMTVLESLGFRTTLGGARESVCDYSLLPSSVQGLPKDSFVQ